MTFSQENAGASSQSEGDNCGCRLNGSQRSGVVLADSPKKPGGMTPMTVTRARFNWRLLPMAGAGKSMLPEVVADHRDRGGRPVFACREGAAGARGYTQHLEIVAGHEGSIGGFDGAAAQNDGSGTGSEHARENLLARRHFPIERIAKGQRLLVAHQVDEYELLRASDRQRAEHHGVEHLIDGGVGADAQRQGEDSGGGESRTAAQLAQGIAQVLR